MNHGKEEKRAADNSFRPSTWRGSKAAPPAPVHRAGSSLPNTEYMRFADSKTISKPCI